VAAKAALQGLLGPLVKERGKKKEIEGGRKIN
jgi:hypothetical protein